ncbi:MAG TPA: COX15/CtaA family protein [Terriglobales bacterium]|nr:COX15/CtaA family protein [Terriglobales bacterium]
MPSVAVSDSAPQAPVQEFNFALNLYARVLSVLTVVLLFAGALVTSEQAGLSIPDWPLAYHRLIPPFVGNIRFEYTHRVIATCVGLMTIGILIWLWRAEPRRWLRWFGVVALGTVVVQGILGGLTVLHFQPPWLSAAHASMAQLFFLITVSLVVFTDRRWLTPVAAAQDGSPRVFALGVATTAAIYAQLIVGAGYRHGAIGVAPHLVGAGVVTILAVTTIVLTLRRHRQPALRNAAKLLAVLLAVQLSLGWMAYDIKIATLRALQPPENRVLATSIHLVCGALLLATALVLTLRARKYLTA